MINEVDPENEWVIKQGIPYRKFDGTAACIINGAHTHKENGTYELCGEKVNGNPENIEGHRLIPHRRFMIHNLNTDFESLKAYLSGDNNDIEGIVFYNLFDDRMCKIRKSDFGIKRKKKVQ